MSRFGRNPRNNNEAEYLVFLRTCNEIRAEAGEDPLFGEPVFIDWWTGPDDYAEDYPEARVIFADDDPEVVRVVHKTEAGKATMVAAAERLGWHIAEMWRSSDA